MIAARIIVVLTFNDGVLFRTKKFNPDYRYTSNLVGETELDELVLLDITRDRRGSETFFEVAGGIAENCFAPMTMGGGIKKMEDAPKFFASGADKITVNTGAVDNPELITELSLKYGAQSVVLSIDVLNNEVFTDCGRRPTGMTPVEWAKQGEGLGAGEIILTAMEKDGSSTGYDLELCDAVAGAVKIPVVVLGGACSWKHFLDGLGTGASGVCTQNIYHFTNKSMTAAKHYLSERGVAVRT